MDDIYFSKERKAELEAELHKLTTIERAAIAGEIETAKAHGDLSENAEYHAARERQAKIEDRIRELEYILNHGKISEGGSDSVTVGSTVEVKNLTTNQDATYRIVGLEEQDIMQGKISNTSPIAKALMGKSVGDQSEFETPKGLVQLKIISIS